MSVEARGKVPLISNGFGMDPAGLKRRDKKCELPSLPSKESKAE